MSRDSASPPEALVRLRWQSALDVGPRRGEPVRCGLPLARGQLGDAGDLTLFDGHGRDRPLQRRVLERWPDGSVRWCLLDWLADTEVGDYRLAIGREPATHRAAAPLRVDLEEDGRLVYVDTGAARFCLAVGGRFPFAAAEVDGEAAIDARRSGLFATDARQRRYEVTTRVLEVCESGPVHATLRLRGPLASATGGVLAEVSTFLHFFAGSATVRCDLTLTNRRGAGHPGGRWSLGYRGSIYLRDLALTLALPAASGETVLRCSPEPGSTYEPYGLPFELYQESSGGENWRSRSHFNRAGRIPLRFRGYRLRCGDNEHRGNRAAPVVVLEQGTRSLGVAMEHFWQNFPKAVEAAADELTLRLLPRQFGDLHELQGGEQKTHSFHLAFGSDRVTRSPLAWCRAPLLMSAGPEWYAAVQAVPHLTPKDCDPNGAYLRLVDAAIEGNDTFVHKREVIDEYGWRHFGDLYADHEAVFHRGTSPLVSHYNNQYDAIAGLTMQFLRSGDGRWFRLMDELARHVIDIDVYHTDDDKAAYNHGQFWHTVHYVDAGTGTHRSYPPAEGVSGGGPSPGQLYTTGLMLHHFLTGSVLSRETAVELGQYVIDADDGTRTIFRFLDRGYTGHVSESGFDAYHGPGRTAANAIGALVNAHRLTGHQRFLLKAEQLIRRCIHPRDDLEARNLLDAERRWYYTMFLASLGRYLDHKRLLGESDAMYAYARAALLRYAAWAADHEYPYLERPEILEFPTETWAAQDMRKSEVFRLAARHTVGEKRRRFVERARFFFDASVSQLEQMETRTLCRPVVLLLSLGHGQAHFELHPEDRVPPAPTSWQRFLEPEKFVPQKQRAKRRFLWLALGSAVALALAGLALWL